MRHQVSPWPIIESCALLNYGCDAMKTRADVVLTLQSLLTDLSHDRSSWENPSLERYLDAMAAWLDSAKMRNLEKPSWELICEMLEAAKVYE